MDDFQASYHRAWHSHEYTPDSTNINSKQVVPCAFWKATLQLHDNDRLDYSMKTVMFLFPCCRFWINVTCIGLKEHRPL
jgi:hypothetical protein